MREIYIDSNMLHLQSIKKTILKPITCRTSVHEKKNGKKGGGGGGGEGKGKLTTAEGDKFSLSLSLSL